MLAAKFFSLSYDEDQETPWLQNPTVYKTQQFLHKKDELGKILSLVTICLNKLCLTHVQLVPPLTIILLYV